MKNMIHTRKLGSVRPCSLFAEFSVRAWQYCVVHTVCTVRYTIIMNVCDYKMLAVKQQQ